jgi:hypothetical protein
MKHWLRSSLSLRNFIALPEVKSTAKPSKSLLGLAINSQPLAPD